MCVPSLSPGATNTDTICKWKTESVLLVICIHVSLLKIVQCVHIILSFKDLFNTRISVVHLKE